MTVIRLDRTIAPSMSEQDGPGEQHPNCARCKLWEGCESPFMPMDSPHDDEGQPLDADILFVGEAPGAEEDKQGTPFVGASGAKLRAILSPLEGEQRFAYTNVVRCRPENNKTPTPRQIEACLPFALQDIEQTTADVIVPLGGTALQAITGHKGITDWHGTVLRRRLERGEVYMLPTYHPAYLLYRRDSLLEEAWISDLADASNLAEGTFRQPADAHVDYRLITTLDEARAMFDRLKQAGRCGFDLEFTSTDAFMPGNQIIMASFAHDDIGYALPLVHSESPFRQEERAQLMEWLTDFAADEGLHKVGHNIKIDALLLKATQDVELLGIDGDTMLMSQIADSRIGVHGLKRLSGRHLDMWDFDVALREYIDLHPEADPKKVIDKETGRKGHYGNIPLTILWPYAARDAASVLLLEKHILPTLNEKEHALYQQLLVPCSLSFARMEASGFYIDQDTVAEYRQVYEAKCEELLEQMREHPGVQAVEARKNADLERRIEEETDADKRAKLIARRERFNPNSDVQLREVVYGKTEAGGLGMIPYMYTAKKNMPSTSQDALAEFSDPWLDLYRVWKIHYDAISKYLKPMQTKWVGYDGRVHSSFNITGAVTGRPSSKDPNIQNIPRPDKHPNTLLATRPIKNVFRHTYPGGWLVQVDLSQIELRVMACASNCTSMLRMFHEGKDIHAQTASQIFGVPLEEVTKTQRSKAKSVNFGVPYGRSWMTIAREYNLSDAEAKDTVTRWFATFPEVVAYQDACRQSAREKGYVLTPFGRKRYIDGLQDRSLSPAHRAHLEREAINHPIQGGASDILIMGQVVHDDILHVHDMRTMTVNIVHDSILFDVHPDELGALLDICRDVFPNLHDYAREYFPAIDLSWFSVPLISDIEIGKRYGSLKPIEEFELEEAIAS